MNVDLKGVVRSPQSGISKSENVEYELELSDQGDLLVAQGLQPMTPIVQRGDSWWILEATAVAPVVALPTTTAQLTLQNLENDDGKSLVIDELFCHVLVSAAAATSVGMVFMLNSLQLKGAPLTQGALTVRSFSGKSYGGKALHQVGATVVDGGWRPYGTAIVGAASQIMQTFSWPTQGGIIVPPGYKFSVSVVANTVTTITTRAGLSWTERKLRLG